MSYCLNPNCQKPQNLAGTIFCESCGLKLLLRERYRTIKLLGQGGFGRTFLAVDEDKPSKPRCVIKQFFPVGASLLPVRGSNNETKAAELFEQEAMRLDNLGRHPQIPELLAYFTQDNRQYLVQEFIEGQNLAEVLKAEGAFRETQIRNLLNSLLSVVEFIHDRNVIHRDIKPENTIRRLDEQLVLVDFGAAKFATGAALATTGTVIGSAGYTAPEQTRGKAVLSSDLYSLGVTCIHLLTEVDSFDLFSDSEDTWVWRDYLNDNPVSAQLGQVLDKMLERATSRRYQSAAKVLTDLNSQRTTVASTPSTPLAMATASVITTVQSTPQMQKWRCVETLIGHEKRLNAIALSPNGQTIASGGADKTIKLWNLTTGEIRTLKGHAESIRAIAFSPDGQMLVSGSNDGTIKVWQLAESKNPLTLKGHSGYVISVAITPDGQTLASGGEGEVTELKLWHLGTVKEICTLEHYSLFCFVAVSPDGQTLAVSRFGGIQLWQMPTREKICTLKRSGMVSALAFSPDGQTLAGGSDDKTIKIWQLSTGEILRTLKTQSSGLNSAKGHSAEVNAVAFSPDGQTLASASHDKTIKIWQLSTGKVISTLTEHSDKVMSVAFSPDGQMLVSCSWDRTVKIWRCD
jgi:WD40 repeat protein